MNKYFIKNQFITLELGIRIGRFINNKIHQLVYGVN